MLTEVMYHIDVVAATFHYVTPFLNVALLPQVVRMPGRDVRPLPSRSGSLYNGLGLSYLTVRYLWARVDNGKWGRLTPQEERDLMNGRDRCVCLSSFEISDRTETAIL